MSSSVFAWKVLWEEETARERPLCVDLDGTLVSTDTLWECVLCLFRRRPWLLLLAPFWLFAGKASFKRQVSARVVLDPASLPYRQDLLEALQHIKGSGRKLVLATAADHAIAHGVAQHLGLFDEVMASDGHANLRAATKRERLVRAYAHSGFDYVGDSHADLSVFERATRGFLVGSSARVAAQARNKGNVTIVSSRPSVLRALIKELRVHQWAKNALVVLPVFMAPGVPPLELLGRALLAALAFSLCASAGYVWNDLLDIEADRAHQTKKNRPFASGALPVAFGPPLFIGLIAVGFGLSVWTLPARFSLMLVLYFAGTLGYSLYLKRVLIVDVIVLAGLYTHRILAGGIATGIPISSWLMGFSLFLFTSLAFAKRYVELAAHQGDEKIKNRDYYKVDLQMIGAMGPASGFLAALVFSLYVEMGSHASAYAEPIVLWLAVPVWLYWVTRIWILTGRGQMQDDPVRFAIKDRASWICGLTIGLVAVLARFTPSWLIDFLQAM
ncbi:MAG TPA: UbiA family prenyltransferase [Polyangiales bacterium]|nr:UbiA family prenyltransferase [Polyangiales bacterium]